MKRCKTKVTPAFLSQTNLTTPFIALTADPSHKEKGGVSYVNVGVVSFRVDEVLLRGSQLVVRIINCDREVFYEVPVHGLIMFSRVKNGDLRI